MGGSSVRPQDLHGKHRKTRLEQEAERTSALTAARSDLLLFTTTWQEFHGRTDQPAIAFGMSFLDRLATALSHVAAAREARHVLRVLRASLNTEGFSPAIHNYLVVLEASLKRLQTPKVVWTCPRCGSLMWKLAPEVVEGLDTGRSVRTCVACGLVDAEAEKRRTRP